LDNWVQRYAFRRYGIASKAAALAWNLLQNSVYNCSTSQEGTSGSIIAARPHFNIERVGCCAPAAIYYDPNDVMQAWKYLLQAGQESSGLANLDGFKVKPRA